VWALVLFYLFATVPAQAQDDGLTLPLAVEVALRTNPMTRAAGFGREMADAQIEEARAGRMPLLQVSENFAAGNNPVFVFGSLLEQARFTQRNFDLLRLNNPDPISNFRTSLTFKMPIFDPGQTATRIERSKLGRQMADKQTTLIEQQIRFAVLKGYYDLLLAEARKEVADEAVKMAEADVKRSRDRVETGLAVVSDLLAAEVQLAEFKQQQIETQGELMTARAALNTAMGLPVNTAQKIRGALLEKTFDLPAQEELVRQALENRPEYSRAALNLASNESAVRGVRGEALPRVDVYANIGASTHNLTGGSSDYTVGASVTFDLFNAGRKARLAEAQAARSMAESEQQQLANQIRLDVVRAEQQFIAARERLAVASRIISHATEALRIVQDRYNEGLTTITEVLRAETALTRARMNILAARHDHYIGYGNLLLVTGRLVDMQPFVS
jgi:outer membrane protein TolC